MDDQDHAAVRRALRALSRGTPARPWIGPAVERRAAELRRRRTAGGAGALALAAVLGVTALQLPAGSRQTVRPAADAQPDLVPSPPVPLPTLPVPLPTASEPPGLPSPEPSHSPRPKRSWTPTSSPEPDPTPPPGYDGPVHIRLAADPADTATATTVAFTVSVRQPQDVPVLLAIDFGDGQRYDHGRDFDPCAIEWHAQSEYELRFEHAYRAAGDYEVTVTARSYAGDPCVEEVLEDRVRVHVAQGADVSNGPALPRVKGAARHVEDRADLLATRSVWRVQFVAGDHDGWITSVVVDWGDGTEPTVVDYGTEGCADSPTAWPEGRAKGEVEHEYADKARYQVRLTVTSAGCDGRDEQSYQFPHRIPAGG